MNKFQKVFIIFFIGTISFLSVFYYGGVLINKQFEITEEQKSRDVIEKFDENIDIVINGTIDIQSYINVKKALNITRKLKKKLDELEVQLQIRSGKLLSIEKDKCKGLSTSCSSATKLEEKVTIAINLVDAPDIVKDRTNIVLEGIRNNLSDIQIFIATNEPEVEEKLKLKGSTERIIHMKKSSSASRAWNILINKISTPYTFIARELLHFDGQSFLPTLVETLEATGATAVGGASRDMEGHWRHGCTQFQIQGYTMEFQSGYKKPLHNCMKCDFVEGPILVRTNMFQLDMDLSRPSAFLDFFLESYLDDSFSLSCPRSMFYQHYTDLSYSKSYLRDFAKKRNLDTFLFPEVIVAFNCSELGFRCGTSHIREGYSLPRCCIRNLIKGLGYFSEFLNSRNRTFFVYDGSLLNALKLGTFAPWDIDCDVRADKGSHKLIVGRKGKKWFKERGFTVQNLGTKANKNGYELIYNDGYDIELWHRGEGEMFYLEELPPEFRDRPTTIKVDNLWFPTTENPAEILDKYKDKSPLEHIQRNSKTKYVYSHFAKCPKENYYNCLDRYPIEGSIGIWPGP